MCPGRWKRAQAPGRELFSLEIWTSVADSLKLSGRELQIVRHIFEERTEREIAEACGISTHTVHTHLERLYHKLAVHSRVGLVLRIVSECLALSDRAPHGMNRSIANLSIVRLPTE